MSDDSNGSIRYEPPGIEQREPLSGFLGTVVSDDTPAPDGDV